MRSPHSPETPCRLQSTLAHLAFSPIECRWRLARAVAPCQPAWGPTPRGSPRAAAAASAAATGARAAAGAAAAAAVGRATERRRVGEEQRACQVAGGGPPPGRGRGRGRRRVGESGRARPSPRCRRSRRTRRARAAAAPASRAGGRRAPIATATGAGERRPCRRGDHPETGRLRAARGRTTGAGAVAATRGLDQDRGRQKGRRSSAMPSLAAARQTRLVNPSEINRTKPLFQEIKPQQSSRTAQRRMVQRLLAMWRPRHSNRRTP